MEDAELIEMFWQRDERGIAELQQTYGSQCARVAGNILSDPEDVRECLNDAYLALWNRIPPERPDVLPAYLLKIVHNLSLKRYHYLHREKRNKNAEIPMTELEGVLCTRETAEDHVEASELSACLAAFIRGLPEEKRQLFIRRYWYQDSIEAISRTLHLSESNVKTTLFRLRQQLRLFLQKEGYNV